MREPPHVHVRKGDSVAKRWLHPVGLAFARGFNPSEIARIREITLQHRVFFVEGWDEHFGPQL